MSAIWPFTIAACGQERTIDRGHPVQSEFPVKAKARMAKRAEVYQADSRIDGIGAFAGQAFKRRAKIGELDGDLVSVREARRRARGRERIHIVELDAHHALDATLGVSPLKFVNHGCAPNTYVRIAYGRVEFYALRDIAFGEELTAGYGETHHEGTLPCKCGMLSCQRYL